MSLVLEVEFLTGVYRGARSPASQTPDWPPQPDRVFSALVSAWASRGERANERGALEWLETAQAPTVYASEWTARPAVACYVPPNDFRSPPNALDRQKWYRDFLACGRRFPEKGGYKKAWQQALSTCPEYRQRKERRFPVACPEDPVLVIHWPEDPGLNLCESLDGIARDVSYLGHSASLVRCRFHRRDFDRDDSKISTHPGEPARRGVYPGRLAELEAAHRANPVRPAISPGVSTLADARAPRAASAAGADWLVLEAMDRDAPDLRASALVCRALRRAVMSGYRRAGLGAAIPGIVSGHTADRQPTRHPHLAVIPLAFTGYRHADGRVFGFALVPPAGANLRDVPGFRKAFEAIAPYDPGQERRVLKLVGAPLVKPLHFAPAGVSTIQSLSPEPYLQPARVWASVTPIVLDRHLKQNGDGEIRDMVATACENAGLPRPEPDRIRIGKHSAVEGAPPARPSAGAPPWTRWKVPESLDTRSLVHAVIDFGRKTAGPVLLGAGRFTGLGVCRRLGG